MGKTIVVLPDELDREFRSLIPLKFGGRKGALSKAVEEAVRLWVKENKGLKSKNQSGYAHNGYTKKK